MSVETKLMTADELLAMPDDGSRKYELLDGELMTMSPSGAKHSNLALRIGAHLMAYADAHGLGTAYGADGGFIISRDPDTVLSPDASFVRRERFVESDGFFPGQPDLAVEVISPNDSYMDVDAKVSRYLEAGTIIVIVVNPRHKTAKITTAHGSKDITLEETLTGGDVIPGWELSMRELFD